ncbi:hypothetical protein D3C75_668150 [compost metagenome]
MGVPMEETFDQDLVDDKIRQLAGQQFFVDVFPFQPHPVRQGDALHKLHGHDPPCGVVPEHIGNQHILKLPALKLEFLRLPRFRGIIQLRPDGLGNLLHHITDTVVPRPLQPALRHPGEFRQNIQIGIHDALDIGPLHLHRRGCAVLQHRMIHLADGGGGNGGLREGDEQVAKTGPQLLLHNLYGIGVRKGRHLILELHQLRDDAGRNQIGPCAGNLPQLDKGRAQILQHQPDPLTDGFLVNIPALVVAQEWNGLWKAQLAHHIAEAVAGQGYCNFPVPVQVTEALADIHEGPASYVNVDVSRRLETVTAPYSACSPSFFSNLAIASSSTAILRSSAFTSSWDAMPLSFNMLCTLSLMV